MNKPIIAGANPYVSVGRTPLNTTDSYNDPDYDETVLPLYQGFLNDKNLKISFTVMWNNRFDVEMQQLDTTSKAYREFQVVKINSLYLHGIDSNKHTDPNEKSGVLSANPEIVQVLFNDVLSPYGIVLTKVNMHDYKDFECIDFTFVNDTFEEQLYDLIDYTFRKNLT